MPSFLVNTTWAAMSEVVPGLFISGVSALSPSAITALRISCVINCTEEVPNLAALSGEVDRIKLWLGDTDETDISEQLDLVADQIQTVITLGGKVLVHCVAGVSRSAAFVLAYLLKFSPLVRNLREAFHLLASVRPLVRPNLGFWRQLLAFEERLKGRRSVRILMTSGSEGQLVPDVYLRQLVPERAPAPRPDGLPELCLDKENSPVRDRQPSGSKPKFCPILASLPEVDGVF